MIAGKPNKNLTVAVCGGSGKFGSLLIRQLHRRYRTINFDPRKFIGKPQDVVHHTSELSSRKTRDKFRKRNINCVVYLGTSTISGKSEPLRYTRAIEDYSKLLEYCDKYDVQKLLLLSSANVYGPRAGNSQFLREDSPLLSSDLFALRDMDMMTQSFFWKRPDIETIILRPCHIAGRSNGVLSTYLRLDRPISLMGFNPMIQLIHENDAIHAILKTLETHERGIFNLAGPQPVSLHTIFNKLGKRPVSVPHVLAIPLVRQMKQLGLFKLHPAYIDYLRYVCMVDDSRARTRLNYKPRHNIDETIDSIIRGPL